MKGILIFYYIGGAGGKFIANCLTYSRQVAFSNYEAALRNDPVEYHQLLLETIPDKSDSRDWLNREHGCWQLFGDAIYYIKEHGVVPDDVKRNDLSKLGDVWLPIMAHHQYQVPNIQRYFADVPQHVIVVDTEDDFIDLAIRLKWQSPLACLDLDRYDEFQQEIQSMSMDYCFKKWNPLKPDATDQIKQFAQYLGFELDLTPAKEYIDKYIDFHQ